MKHQNIINTKLSYNHLVQNDKKQLKSAIYKGAGTADIESESFKYF